MTTSQDTRIAGILTDPSAAYDQPMEVVRDDTLSRDEKIRVLEEWKFHANELIVAGTEGMTGGEPDMLSRVNDALLALRD